MNTVFTDEERREITGRARTLHERMGGPENDRGSKPPIEPEEILHKWKDLFPDEESFERRLKRAGVTKSRARELIAATHWPANEPLPEWIYMAEDVIGYLETASPPDHGAVSADAETPFRELLAPIAGYAREQLSSASFVPEEAISPMIEGAVTQLELLCTRVLYVEFKSFVEYHDSELADTNPDEVTDPPTAYYEQFIDAMFDRGFKNLCVEYPVLARQLVQLIEHWTDAVDEVRRHIRADQNALREQFGVSGDVVALEPLSEDAHAGGRLPIRVSFESGTVIYKPRPIDGGIAFYEILDRLNDHLSIPAIRAPTYLPRDEYGWMEPIKYRDLPSDDAADRYYERAGSILCVAYALNFTDIQLENLIVDGEDPMVIDGETIFHPHIEPGSWPVSTEIPAITNESVLLTALLPFSAGDPRKPDKEGFASSLAGLGRKSDRTKLTNRTRPRIDAVNTDVMSVDVEHVKVGLSTNTPSVDGEDQPPSAYAETIIRGFEETYETIRELHADDRFFSDIADLELIDGVENRLVYRATAEYVSILRSAVARDPLRDGARLSLEFEPLAAAFFNGRIETDRYWPLYETERRALRRLDVPRLSSRVDRQTVSHDGTELDIAVDQSGYERARARLDAMDAADRRRQAWLIRQSFDETVARSPTPSPIEPIEGQYLREAEALFDKAVEAKIDTADSWVSITPGFSGVNLYPADHSLYWGRGGIALTAAALYDATDHDRYRRQVDEILAPTIEELTSGTFSAGLGGIKGVGSVVYLLSVIAELLDEERYRECAETVTQTVTEELLSIDNTLDVMEGASGTLLGLLAYHDRYGGPHVLDRAVACGDRLLEARTDVDGYRVWITTDEQAALTGFSHGSSGIAYALARLAATTGESQYAEAARESLEFESSLYKPSRSNWPRSTERNEYVDRWCHGRSGMALARIGIGKQLGDATVIDEGVSALSTTAVEDPATVDNVCCGNAGRVEALLVGGHYTSEYRTSAIEEAGRILARRSRDGTLSLPGHSQWFTNPTFFDGVVGVAYTLLRLRDPDALPSVLLLE